MEDILSKPVVWGLDPLFHTHVKLFTCVLRQLIPANWGDRGSIYFYKFSETTRPRPIRLVHVAGIVVYVIHRNKVGLHFPSSTYLPLIEQHLRVAKSILLCADTINGSAQPSLRLSLLMMALVPLDA